MTGADATVSEPTGAAPNGAEPTGAETTDTEATDTEATTAASADGRRLGAPWPTTAERAPDGVVRVGGLSVRDLAARFGTPVFVLDEVDLRVRARVFRDAFAEAFRDVGGGVDVYYAGKAFLCAAVARWVHEEGLRIDAASAGELATALLAGVPPADVGLHGNNKSDVEIDRAVASGVGRIVVDSLAEIDRLAQAGARHGRRVPVMVRVTAGVHAHTHEFVSTAHEDQKFGLSLAGGQAAEAVRRILAHDALDLRGLHSHIGSQILDGGGFALAARRLLDLRARVRAESGYLMPELDLGGGYGIAYTGAEDVPPVPELAAGLARVVRDACADLGTPAPRVSIEPGRAIVGPSTITLYTVGTVKRVATGAPEGPAVRTYVSVDGGMSDNIRTALYGAEYTAALVGRAPSAATEAARVVGKHCESGDVVVRDVELPGDLSPGDLLAVPATGAYGRAMASSYNLVPRPGVVAVRGGVAQVVLTGETERDVLALDPGLVGALDRALTGPVDPGLAEAPDGGHAGAPPVAGGPPRRA